MKRKIEENNVIIKTKVVFIRLVMVGCWAGFEFFGLVCVVQN